MFHPSYFLNMIGSNERDDTGIYVRCRSDFKESGGVFSGFRSLTDAERAEQQANRFSAAVLMPRSAVKILLAGRPYNHTEGWICSAMEQISDTFNVSKAAAFYRLKGLEMIGEYEKMPF